MKDKNGIDIKVGDIIKVPDNPEICPVDFGRVVISNGELTFMGTLSIRPMSFYENENMLNEVMVWVDARS